MDGEQWLTSYRERLDRIGRRAARVQEALAAVEGTAMSRDGAAVVTVDHAGVLRRLVLTERADALDRAQLASAVLAAAGEAQKAAARQTAAALEPLVGADPEVARMVGHLTAPDGPR